MTQPIAANYELAQAKITEGVWRVDPAAGLVFGPQGRPFRRVNSWGYVQIKFRDALNWRAEHAVLAHRVIGEFVHGPLDVSRQINHINGVKIDNRLGNLEAVNPSENMRHAFAVGLNTPARPTARLTPQQVQDIYRRCWSGERDDDLAAEYGMKRSAISNIRHGWSWRHVTGHVPKGRSVVA